MEAAAAAIPNKCYQCDAAVDLVFDDHAAESGWFSCGRCGERVVSVADFTAYARDHADEAVRAKLGVDEFLHARRVDHDVRDD